jgi:hypothetical protein
VLVAFDSLGEDRRREVECGRITTLGDSCLRRQWGLSSGFPDRSGNQRVQQLAAMRCFVQRSCSYWKIEKPLLNPSELRGHEPIVLVRSRCRLCGENLCAESCAISAASATFCPRSRAINA